MIHFSIFSLIHTKTGRFEECKFLLLCSHCKYIHRIVNQNGSQSVFLEMQKSIIILSLFIHVQTCILNYSAHGWVSYLLFVWVWFFYCLSSKEHTSPTKEWMAKLGEGDLAEITPRFSGKLHAVENISTLKSRDFQPKCQLHTYFSNGIWDIHKIFTSFRPAVPSNHKPVSTTDPPRRFPPPQELVREMWRVHLGSVPRWFKTKCCAAAVVFFFQRDSLDVYFFKGYREIVFLRRPWVLENLFLWGFFVAKEVDFKLKRSRSQQNKWNWKVEAKLPCLGNSETAPELSKEEEA